MRTLGLGFAAAASLLALPASAVVINVSPADGPTAYTKIEAAVPGDEVIIAPGTYAFRVYLQNQGDGRPAHLHPRRGPGEPPRLGPGRRRSSTTRRGATPAGDKARGCWQVSGGTNYTIESIVFKDCHAADNDSAGLRYYSGTTGLEIEDCLFEGNDNGLTGGTEDSEATVEFCEFAQQRQHRTPRAARPRTTSTSTGAPSRCGTRTCTTRSRRRTSTAAPSPRPSSTTGSTAPRATSATS